MVATSFLLHHVEAGPMTVGGDLNRCDNVSLSNPRCAFTSSGGVRASHCIQQIC